jgi:hypothetical protein
MQTNMAGRHKKATIGEYAWQTTNTHIGQTPMTDVQHRAAAIVVQAIVETIEEMGDKGAPLGIIYAALMGMISYNSFVNVIQSLVQAGIIRVSNNVAYPVKS